MKTANNYFFGPTSSDYSGQANTVYCDCCGAEIGMYTPAQAKQLICDDDITRCRHCCANDGYVFE